MRISVPPSGMTRFELSGGGQGDTPAGFAPLGPEGRFHILWVARFDQDAPASGVPYGLLEQRPGGHDRAEAVAAGAAPSAEGGDPDCTFPSRASQEAGSRAYAGHPFDGMELAPVR